MFFSRIDWFPNRLKRVIANTAIGTEALKLSPTSSATYTVTSPKTTPRNDPRSTARSVNSVRLSLIETLSRNASRRRHGGVQLRAVGGGAKSPSANDQKV